MKPFPTLPVAPVTPGAPCTPSIPCGPVIPLFGLSINAHPRGVRPFEYINDILTLSKS